MNGNSAIQCIYVYSIETRTKLIPTTNDYLVERERWQVEAYNNSISMDDITIPLWKHIVLDMHNVKWKRRILVAVHNGFVIHNDFERFPDA